MHLRTSCDLGWGKVGSEELREVSPMVRRGGIEGSGRRSFLELSRWLSIP